MQIQIWVVRNQQRYRRATVPASLERLKHVQKAEVMSMHDEEPHVLFFDVHRPRVDPRTFEHVVAGALFDPVHFVDVGRFCAKLHRPEKLKHFVSSYFF
jgi:hypothetical protein